MDQQEQGKPTGRIKDLTHVNRAEHYNIEIDFVDPHPANLRIFDEEYNAHIEDFVKMLEAGNQLPPIMVIRNGSDRFWSIDGSTRAEAAKRHKVRQGLDKFRIPAVLFNGNESEALVYMMKANTGKHFRPIELMAGYKRFRDTYGWTPKEIAEALGKTEQHVMDILTLSTASEPILNMVRLDEISATVVTQTVRKLGPAAAQSVLEEAKVEAEKGGAPRVMPRHVASVTTKRAAAQATQKPPAGSGRQAALDGLLEAVDGRLTDEDFPSDTVSISGELVIKLLKALGYTGAS